MSQNSNLNRDKKKLDSSSSISDSSANNPKQLLNTYIYDFLVKNKLPQTAKTFVNEADISSQEENSGNSNTSPTSPGFLQYQKDNNLPIVKVTMDAPQSFLFEWWQVFWDVFQAKNNNKQSSQVAMQYYQLQLMKQRQQLDASTMNMMNVVNYQGNGTGTVNPMQSQQQRLMMQYMRQQQQQQQNNGQPPPVPGQPPQPSNQPTNGQNLNGQQMYMMQNLPQNGIQQHAQNQMNNLRLQAAAQKQNDSNSPNPNVRPGSGNFPPQNGQPGNFPPPNGPVMRSNKEIEDSNQPANHSRNANALQDYQMQLMLLEKQNKKRLDIARSSGNEGNLINSMNNNMLPPNQQQLQQALNNGMTSNINNLPMNNGLPPQNVIPNNLNTKPSPATGPSPVIGNKPSPTNANGKKKKEPAKRGRKPSVANNGNNSNAGTPISAPTPSHLKKEISTPLTPTSETPNENGKRKRKNESPKKNGKFKKESIKEEEEKTDEPTEESHNYQEINNDPMFSMDVLESNSNDNLFNQNGIDDIEFDFNMFLDGNVNDDITNFNWGDGIEGE